MSLRIVFDISSKNLPSRSETALMWPFNSAVFEGKSLQWTLTVWMVFSWL